MSKKGSLKKNNTSLTKKQIEKVWFLDWSSGSLTLNTTNPWKLFERQRKKQQIQALLHRRTPCLRRTCSVCYDMFCRNTFDIFSPFGPKLRSHFQEPKHTLRLGQVKTIILTESAISCFLSRSLSQWKRQIMLRKMVQVEVSNDTTWMGDSFTE